MSQPERRFQVIHGGTGGGPGDTYIDTGVVDGTGQPMLRRISTGGPPSGGGGDVTPIWRLDIPRDVQLLKAGFPILLAALGYLSWYVVDELKDVRKDIAGVDKAIGVQTEAIESLEKTIDRIDSRLDGPPPTTAPPKKGRPNG